MMQTINMNRYEEIIDKIKNCVKYYEIALEENKYYLGLSNGDNIYLSCPRNNVAHLLGVHTDKLKSASIIKNNFASYDILKKLINGDLTYSNMKSTNYNFDISSLFSEYIDSKLEIFTNVLKVRTDDMYCIIKYRSDRSYTTGEEKENSDYFIIRKYDKKYSVLGIVKNDDNNNYVPVTSRLFDNYEDLCCFLNKVAKNQEVTYPAAFKIDNYDKSYNRFFYPSLDNKLEYNKTLKNIAFDFDAIPSTNRDFLAIIERLLNSKQNSKNNISILNLIKDNIKANNVIDKEEVKQLLDGLDIPDELDTLIDACNDLMVSKSRNEKTIDASYSSMQKENNDLKEQLLLLKNEINSLRARNSKLEIERDNLKETNDSNFQKLKILTDAFESIKRI